MRWVGFLSVGIWVLCSSTGWAKEPPKHMIQYRTEDCKTNDNARSCAWLGAYLQRQGKRQQALPYYKKACLAMIQPIGMACYLWGLLEKQPKVAHTAFQRACELKDGDGCTTLGDLYAKKGDAAKALGLYRKGCKGQDGRGCYHVARHLLRKKQTSQALRLMLDGCKMGYPPACGYLGQHYETKKRNNKKALILYKHGCKLQGSRVCAQLGLFLLRQGNKKQARTYLQRSCRLGYKRACQRVKAVSR